MQDFLHFSRCRWGGTDTQNDVTLVIAQKPKIKNTTGAFVELLNQEFSSFCWEIFTCQCQHYTVFDGNKMRNKKHLNLKTL